MNVHRISHSAAQDYIVAARNGKLFTTIPAAHGVRPPRGPPIPRKRRIARFRPWNLAHGSANRVLMISWVSPWTPHPREAHADRSSSIPGIVERDPLLLRARRGGLLQCPCRSIGTVECGVLTGSCSPRFSPERRLGALLRACWICLPRAHRSLSSRHVRERGQTEPDHEPERLRPARCPGGQNRPPSNRQTAAACKAVPC
jgi:hypothetical protein